MGKKYAFDGAGPSSTTAWALLLNGKPAGKLVASWSRSRVCHATVWVWDGELRDAMAQAQKNELTVPLDGKAGGYGYDKLSAAVWSGFHKCGLKTRKVEGGNGATRQEFEAWGYEVFEVVG